MQKLDSPYFIERIISALSYLSAGIMGGIWLIIAVILKKTVRPFLIYHIFQSIFLGLFCVLLKFFIGALLIILFKIPLINLLVSKIVYYSITPLPFILNLSVIQVFTTSVLLYLVVTSFLGYYSYLPWISEIIHYNTRR